MRKVSIGDSGLQISSISFGTSCLGDMPDTYGYQVDEVRARDTLHAIFSSPVNLLDTSNNYGSGRSEERIGNYLREIGGLPDGFVLSTKLDRDMQTGRFDAARVGQSLEESLGRLGIDRIPLLHLHDPEHARDLAEITADGGALDELFKLREQGIATTVGLAMGSLDMMFPILKAYPFDALISHNRYTLLNRSANEMFDYAFDNGITILNAAPFAGGVLAKGSDEMPQITYQAADEQALEPVKIIETACAKHNLASGAVALQFSVNDPRIASTIVGVSKAERVKQTISWAEQTIPKTAWDDINSCGYSTEDPEANREYKPG